MRTFEHPNTHAGWTCPICKTAEDKPVVLIPAYGTQQDNLIEAKQFHLDCIDLCYYPKREFLRCRLRSKENKMAIEELRKRQEAIRCIGTYSDDAKKAKIHHYDRALSDAIAYIEYIQRERDVYYNALEQAGRDIHTNMCASDYKPDPHCQAHKDVMRALFARFEGEQDDPN